LELVGDLLLVSHVPYVNSRREICLGTLVSKLDLAGDVTAKPQDHVIYFIGEYPCHKDGNEISQIHHASGNQKIAPEVEINHSFSNKPPGGYADYYAKITRYSEIISAPAKALDDRLTERTFRVPEAAEGESVFTYLDTNSTRAGIKAVSEKLTGQKIAIVGLGGTGSYILDLLAKTPVQEIHLYDGDMFLNHNAFRAPGAAPIETIRERHKKTEYYSSVYSRMHRGVFSHPVYIDASNVVELDGLTFVFVSLDKGEARELVVRHLIQLGIPFIDVGIGIERVDNQLLGVVRTTLFTDAKSDRISERIPFTDGENNEYSRNIQVADLNALNAALAVIRWKKLLGFYQDLEHETLSVYSINVSQLLIED
jgi:hypothetical protein